MPDQPFDTTYPHRDPGPYEGARLESFPGRGARGLPGSAVLVLLVLFGSCATPPPTIDLLISGGRVIDVTSDEPPEELDIAIDDGRIVALGEDLARDYAATETIDATGHFVMPGLADMHSHFGNGILAPEEDDTTQVLARHLYYGNTTILNLGSFHAWPARIDELRAQMATGALEGPRLLAVGALLTRVGSHPTTTIYAPPVQERIAEIVAEAPPTGPVDLTPLRATTLVRTPADVAEEVLRVATWGADAIKITVESGPPGFGERPRMTPEMISAAVEAARPFGIPVLCHISQLPELEDCLALGADGAVHGLTPEEPLPEDLERRMVDRDFALIPTAGLFDGWVRLASDSAWIEEPFLAETISRRELEWLGAPEMIERMAWPDTLPVRRLEEHIRKFHELGGWIVAGTDTGNPYRFAGYALHEELAFYVRSGLSERQALATATIEAARLVGAEDDWGSVRKGLSADLVVLGANPLEDIANTRGILEVIRAGRRIDRSSLPVR